MCGISLTVFIIRQQNPLERHMTDGWKGLSSPQPVSPRNTSGTTWKADGWQDMNQGPTLQCVLMNLLHRIKAECGIWAS